jgi:uncharacterized protein (TIGR02301 family)
MRLAVHFVCVMLRGMFAFRLAAAVGFALWLAAAPAQAQSWGNGWGGGGWGGGGWGGGGWGGGGWGSPNRQQAPRSSAPSTPKLPPQTSAPVQPATQDQSTPYDPDLQRLSEILGALHFLRGICNSNEGQKWRNEAQALIDAEAPSGTRRDQMVASFNRGYRGFQQTYRNCTPAADIVIKRYLEEGAKIARDITARFAN